MKAVSIKVSQHFPNVVRETIWLFIEEVQLKYKVHLAPLQYVELLPQKDGQIKIVYWQEEPSFLFTWFINFRETLPTFQPFWARLYVQDNVGIKTMMYENEYWYFIRLGGASLSAKGGDIFFSSGKTEDGGAELPLMNEKGGAKIEK